MDRVDRADRVDRVDWVDWVNLVDQMGRVTERTSPPTSIYSVIPITPSAPPHPLGLGGGEEEQGNGSMDTLSIIGGILISSPLYSWLSFFSPPSWEGGCGFLTLFRGGHFLHP